MRPRPARTLLLAAATLAMMGWLLARSAPAGRDAAAEFLLKRQQTDPKSVDAQMALGRWAEERGLALAAADVYAVVLTLDPDHVEAYSRLSRIGDNARLPDEPEVERQTVEALKPYGQFRTLVTPHFIIAYNTDERFARERGALLEETHRRFFDSFRKAEQRPLPLRKRLVCVLFSDRPAFVRYAREVDRNLVDWTSGYYSSGTNRVAFFDDKDNPAFEQHHDDLRKMNAQVDALQKEYDQARRGRNAALTQEVGGRLEKARDERNFLDNRLREVVKRLNASKTTHEATHQLAYNTGIQSDRKTYPFWLNEGLATNFEADEGPGAPFGPFIDNKGRRLMLREIEQSKRLKPLRQFVVVVHDLPADADEVRALYGQAWGLFNFLFKNRHEQFRDYLEALADAPDGQRDAATLLKEFDRCFGGIDQVELEFREWAKLQ